MGNYILGHFLIWLPFVLSLVVVILIIIRRILRNSNYSKTIKLGFLTHQKLICIWSIFIILFNLFLSWLQYYVWSSSPLSRLFLPPTQPISYFIGYIYIHLWQAVLLSLVVAAVFYGIFRLVRFYNQEAVSLEEAALISLACLLVGWPKLLILIPLFFLLSIFSSIVNLFIFKNKKIDIFWPLIISLLLALSGGNYLIYFFMFVV